MDMGLKDKVAIVTGAGRGIGEAIALELAKEGAIIVAADINFEASNLLMEKIYAHNKQGIAIRVDISNKKDISMMVDTVIEKFEKIDVLINNAGITQKANIEDITENDWDRMLDINLRSAFFCTQAVFYEMKKKRYGKIVNIASMAGQRPGPYSSVNYCCAKSGLMAMTKSFAYKGGEYNINANSIAPGFILTKMAEEVDFINSNNLGVPLGRMGTVQDVANAVVFLSSDRSGYITGATIDVNGGVFMR